MTPAIVWFRLDLRLQDNPALSAALVRGGPVIPLYVLDDEADGAWRAGAASRWWLHHSLESLGQSLSARGSRLVVRSGDSAAVIEELIRESGAGAVYWNRRYEPAIMSRDAALKSRLGSMGLEARSFNSALLFEPHRVRNKQGGPFQVFTPFWRHCLDTPVEAPVVLGDEPLAPPKAWPRSLKLAELRLLPTLGWDAGFREAWKPGEVQARARLHQFARAAMEAYASHRDFPAGEGTSRLSAALHFGELGPRQVWAEVAALSRESGVFPPSNGARVFLSEVGWREFAHHLLYHFPETPHKPLRAQFERFAWSEDPKDARLKAWQKGRTGYPIVDAGMRELWHTGWMHNRVRMIVASFLVKHLGVSWKLGAQWFWDTLVDADLASNTLGWQWTAGCGADAAPFFRIFAPVLQGMKFDPEGDYVRRWVPELARVPTSYLHSPWTAPDSVLEQAGVRLGSDYPLPIVDHAKAREKALADYKALRSDA